MKGRIGLLIAVAALLLLGATAVAQLDDDDASAVFIVEEGIAVGGDYRLSSLSRQVGGASGGDYRLLATSSANASPPPSAEVGCCCTYLPCTLRALP